MNTVTQETSSNTDNLVEVKEVIVLFASPKKRGSTSALLEEVIKTLHLSDGEHKITYINMYAQNIKPCIDCKMCLAKACPFNYEDDMQKILSQINNANIVIIATPIYFNSFPTVLKAFVDRLNQFYVQRFVVGNPSPFTPKCGYLVTTMGSDDFEHTVRNAVEVGAKMALSCLNIKLAHHFNKAGTDVKK